MRPAVTSYLSRRTVVVVGRGSERQQLSCCFAAFVDSKRPHVVMPAVALPTVPLHERAVTQRIVNEQKPDAQSPSTAHFSLVASVAPSLQRRAFVGAPPPQSTSVSVPFWRPSLFAGGL